MEDMIITADLSAEALARALREAELHLADVQDERRFTLGQTGVHLGGKKAAALRASWDREEHLLRERIARLKALLADRATS